MFVDFPFSSIPRNALAAGQVVMCAAREHRFWPVDDALYARQEDCASPHHPLPRLIALADSAGAAHDSLAHCMTSRGTIDTITREYRGSANAAANATPSLYIEGGLPQSAIPAAPKASVALSPVALSFIKESARPGRVAASAPDVFG